MKNQTNIQEKKNPKYRTFIVYGFKGQWKIWVLAPVLLAIIFWGTDYYFHLMALRDLKDKTDVIDINGVIIQTNEYACAPASLTMLMRDNGIDATQYDMAKAAYTGILGTWSRSIAVAGREYGFDVEVARLDFDQIIDKNLPMIIEEDEHVVYAVPDLAGRFLHVKDPSMGFALLDKVSFYEYFKPSEKKKCFIFKKK